MLRMLAELFRALSGLAERGADLPMAGRTHGQQAVPITFGFKVASWIDEFSRHVQRLHAVEPRVFTAMLGGAVGNFASLGEAGPDVQARVAAHLGLTAMKLPSRAVGDSLAEYVCILALIAGTGARIAGEVYALSRTEIGEVAEPAPHGTIGSSTMPHKRNPQLADDCLALSAEIRALAPLALEGMLRDHEVDGAHTDMTDTAVHRACLATGALLLRLITITGNLTLDPGRMRANLDVTGGLIASERVMLALGHLVGRKRAHQLVHDAARDTTTTKTFLDALAADTRITEDLTRDQLADLLRPENSVGLSTKLAREAALTATELSHQLAHRTASP
jgi:3-carboxy-cis,cis-muconate cycloisomerase